MNLSVDCLPTNEASYCTISCAIAGSFVVLFCKTFKMEWNTLAVERLIEVYREKNCLYNTKSPNYHTKHSRKEALERITSALRDVRPSTTGVYIMSKMISFTSFVAEFNNLNKIKQPITSVA